MTNSEFTRHSRCRVCHYFRFDWKLYRPIDVVMGCRQAEGDCIRHPPKIVRDDGLSVFPKVLSDWSCGEFDPFPAHYFKDIEFASSIWGQPKGGAK